MLREMSARQLHDWIAFDHIEPIGGQRGDWQAASICNSVMNAAAITVRSKKRFRVRDWLLSFGDAKEVKKEDEGPTRQTWEEQKKIAMRLSSMFNRGNQRGNRRS